jgi:hypothetical protein
MNIRYNEANAIVEISMGTTHDKSLATHLSKEFLTTYRLQQSSRLFTSRYNKANAIV